MFWKASANAQIALHVLTIVFFLPLKVPKKYRVALISISSTTPDYFSLFIETHIHLKQSLISIGLHLGT